MRRYSDFLKAVFQPRMLVVLGLIMVAEVVWLTYAYRGLPPLKLLAMIAIALATAEVAVASFFFALDRLGPRKQLR